MTEKVTLREVLNDKMMEIENHFIKGHHLDDKYKDTIKDQLAWIQKMWPIVSPDDKEWIEAAIFAMENKLEWK